MSKGALQTSSQCEDTLCKDIKCLQGKAEKGKP